MPNQNRPTSTQVSARAPAEVKAALVAYANELNGRDPYTEVKQADILREALMVYLIDQWNDLPEESLKHLDRSRLKDEIDDGLGVGL